MTKIRTLHGRPHPADVDQLVEDMLAGKWQNPIHRRFQEKAEEAGFEVREYHGRYLYYGPAVSVKDQDEFQEFLQRINTTIKLQWDDLGKTGKIIYPK